jgi:hypothetical protein
VPTSRQQGAPGAGLQSSWRRPPAKRSGIRSARGSMAGGCRVRADGEFGENIPGEALPEGKARGGRPRPSQRRGGAPVARALEHLMLAVSRTRVLGRKREGREPRSVGHLVTQLVLGIIGSEFFLLGWPKI